MKLIEVVAVEDRSRGASQDVVYEAGEARGPAALRVGRP